MGIIECCPQNAYQNNKKSCWNSKETRDSKFLPSLALSCKYSLLMILQKEDKEDPALSGTAVWADGRDHDGNLTLPSFAVLNENQLKRSIAQILLFSQESSKPS